MALERAIKEAKRRQKIIKQQKIKKMLKSSSISPSLLERQYYKRKRPYQQSSSVSSVSSVSIPKIHKNYKEITEN